MTLDAKRTFDELIERLAPDAQTRDEILEQPDLPAALGRGRRLAGVHGGRQALRPRPLRALRRARPRHARRRATRSTSSTRPIASPASSRAARCSVFLAPTGLAATRVGRGDGRRLLRAASALTGVDLLRGPQRVLPRAGRRCSTGSASAPRASRRCWATRPPRSSSSPRPSASRSRRRSSSAASCATRACRSAASSSTACTSCAEGEASTRRPSRPSSRGARRGARGEGRPHLRRGAADRRARRRAIERLRARDGRATPGARPRSSTATCTTSTASWPSTPTCSASWPDAAAQPA